MERKEILGKHVFDYLNAEVLEKLSDPLSNKELEYVLSKLRGTAHTNDDVYEELLKLNPLFKGMKPKNRNQIFIEFSVSELMEMVEAGSEEEVRYKSHEHRGETCPGFYCRGCSGGIADELGISGSCTLNVPCHICFSEEITMAVYEHREEDSDTDTDEDNVGVVVQRNKKKILKSKRNKTE